MFVRTAVFHRRRVEPKIGDQRSLIVLLFQEKVRQLSQPLQRPDVADRIVT